MKGQLQTIELYMLLLTVSFLIGVMYAMYSSSTGQIRKLGERRLMESAISQYCISFPSSQIGSSGKTVGEMMSIYNATGKEVFVFEGKYVINITQFIYQKLSADFGSRWHLSFGSMDMGSPAPPSSMGCRIYIPRIAGKEPLYAVLKVW